jgi:hypothetical protein
MSPKQPAMSVVDAQRVSEILSQREGSTYKFFRFLNLARFSLVFQSENGDQKVLTLDHAKLILNQRN